MPTTKPTSIDVFAQDGCLTYGLFSETSLDNIAALPVLKSVVFRGVGDVNDEATTVFRNAKAICDRFSASLVKSSRSLKTREIVLSDRRYDLVVKICVYPRAAQKACDRTAFVEMDVGKRAP
jgi:hypothetical protein